MTHLLPKPQSEDELRTRLEGLLEKNSPALASISSASEVVIFGSVACGLDGPESDMDVLAVGEGERLRTREIDLIYVAPKTLQERWWLSGELAGHVATYGVWLKGTSTWKSRVFVSSWSLRKKMALALDWMSKLYVRRSILNLAHTSRYLERALLESLRLRRLCDGHFVAATVELMAESLEDDFQIIDDLPKIFGQAPLVMVEEILSKFFELPPRHAISTLFRQRWQAQINRDLQWRLAGRPERHGED